MTVTTRLITVAPDAPRDLGLGRHVEHDEASRGFAAMRTAPIRTVLWTTEAPVLNQGQLGSCTGNAMAGLINTDYFATARQRIKPLGAYLQEADAVAIYSAATKLDDINGEYPPDDTGSSGLAVSKAAKNLGYVRSYSHAFGLDHMLHALQLHPVIVGTDWTSDMFKPDRKGFIKPSGSVQGGHEYLCLGYDADKKFLTFVNSWGTTWGAYGRFFMAAADFNDLLKAQGDVTVPLPISTIKGR